MKQRMKDGQSVPSIYVCAALQMPDGTSHALATGAYACDLFQDHRAVQQGAGGLCG